MSKLMSRRELIGAGGVSLALAVGGCRPALGDTDAVEVAANEDLMREHGVLERLLVIYDAAAARLEAGDRAALDAIRPAARIARDFVEGYHERIEEQYVFPRLERANRLVGLVAVLRAQHDAGRGLTDFIQGLALGALAADRDRASLAGALRGYASMFRPHVAREDSVLFPAFHEVAGASYRELGDEFEAVEQRRFGKNGFEHFVALLPAIETQVGVSDLAKFTVTAPQVEAHSAGRGPSRS